MSATYYRVHPATESPESILDEGRWESRPWIGELYRRCETCAGSGQIWDEDLDDYGDPIAVPLPCPGCGGDGEIEDVRRGVSCCASLDDLAWYLAEHHAAIEEGDWLLTVEGELSDDDDHDAIDGAVLVLPSRIVHAQPVPASWRTA